MRVVWSFISAKDLNGIFEYYAKRSPRAAAEIYNSILDAADLLAVSPYIAAFEPLLNDFPKTYRSFVTSKRKFKIIYYVENDMVHIARVWDCRQNPEKLKKQLSKI